jgi:SET domain
MLTREKRRNRARNNSRKHNSSLGQIVVHPLYSFFNHSCDPSTVDRTELSSAAEQTSRPVMIATKDVKDGEEVCTTYAVPNVLMMPKAMRHQFLSAGSWFGPKVCECTRCLAETR